MKKSYAIALMSLLVLTGCATDNYSVSVQKWIGTRESYLVQGWGEPLKTYTSEQSKFFVYEEDGGTPQGCTTTFEIVDDFVESFDYEGKGCVGDYDTYRYDQGKYRQP